VLYQRAIGAVSSRKGVAAKYLAVSMFNVISHQLVLFAGNTVWGWSGGWANVLAAVVTALPAYLLSRYWVWDLRGPASLRAEVVPFWGIALVGLAVSTGLAESADRLFGTGIAVAIGSLLGYFMVWVAKFLLLDSLFTTATESQAESQPMEPVGQR